ncbi:hypothetical protein DD237_006015 [Peronospora effusa]|uniref:Reverse transcriptase Ty1/copia-type domain-containing protein n=1 Tax=Peronospora effusa TaxID=542832 RepID=A0A3R7Y8G6_9STRA|nr:hypothetical protein DD237_006015 [Peronospora effusa]
MRCRPKQGGVIRFKTRLVARGDKICEDIDFVDTYAPVYSHGVFGLFVALSALLRLNIYNCDVNKAYLMRAYKFYNHVNASNKALIVKKALYGLRQAGREGNVESDRFLRAQEFEHGHTEPCLYVRWMNGEVCLSLVDVDDLLAATKIVEIRIFCYCKHLERQYNSQAPR